MTSAWTPLPGSSGDRHIFAIGDIHGEDKVLAATLEQIKNAPRQGLPTTLVFLGDLIDRGPGSLKCVEMAYRAEELAGVDEVIYLPGNHELMLVDTLTSIYDDAHIWTKNGGTSVLDEAEALRPDLVFKTSQDVRDNLPQFLPDDFIDRMRSRSHARFGDLLFVHAGISPWIPQEEFLKNTREAPWAWIRYDFLGFEGEWGDPDLVVVHGHSPIEEDPASSSVHARSDKMRAFQLGIEHTPDFQLEDTRGCDMVASRRRLNLDTGCGKYLRQTVMAEFVGNQYRLELIAAPDLKSDYISEAGSPSCSPSAK